MKQKNYTIVALLCLGLMSCTEAGGHGGGGDHRGNGGSGNHPSFGHPGQSHSQGAGPQVTRQSPHLGGGRPGGVVDMRHADSFGGRREDMRRTNSFVPQGRRVDGFRAHNEPWNTGHSHYFEHHNLAYFNHNHSLYMDYYHNSLGRFPIDISDGCYHEYNGYRYQYTNNEWIPVQQYSSGVWIGLAGLAGLAVGLSRA